MKDIDRLASDAEARLMATPYEQLSPAGRILVDEIVQGHQTPPGPVRTDGSLEQMFREARRELDQARTQEPGLRAELVNIDEEVSRLQVRRQFVLAKLRNIGQLEANYRVQIGQLERVGRAAIANAGPADSTKSLPESQS